MRTKTKPALAGSAVIKEKPKKLSKIALWRKANPNGIIVVNDRRAVNR